jgi:hypothetical protein
MPTITQDVSPYLGRTSAPPWRRAHDPLECRRCGSSLAGRREAVRQDTTQGIRFVTQSE